jgi:hypothetical protein
MNGIALSDDDAKSPAASVAFERATTALFTRVDLLSRFHRERVRHVMRAIGGSADPVPVDVYLADARVCLGGSEQGFDALVRAIDGGQ